MQAAEAAMWKVTDYGDAGYWDARYKTVKGGAPFDWYRSYAALRPFLRRFVPTSSRVLMLGCGNSLMSEHMVNDGYTEIVNVDISSVVIDMMKQRHGHIPQLTYMQMDVRDMSFFSDRSIDCVVDKGTLDALMCGTNASKAASEMLGEVNRVLKQGGIYMLITYGAPSVRVQHLKEAGSSWKLTLYILCIVSFSSFAFSFPFPRCISLSSWAGLSEEQIIWSWSHPASDSNRNILGSNVLSISCSASSRVEDEINGSSSSEELSVDPVPLTENGQLPAGFVLEDLESHFIYVCEKMPELN